MIILIMNKTDLIPKAHHSFFAIVLTIMAAMLFGTILFESNAVSKIRTQLMHPVLAIGLGILFIYSIYNLTGKYIRLPIIGKEVDTGMFVYICILILILFTFS